MHKQLHLFQIQSEIKVETNCILKFRMHIYIHRKTILADQFKHDCHLVLYLHPPSIQYVRHTLHQPDEKNYIFKVQ